MKKILEKIKNVFILYVILYLLFGNFTACFATFGDETLAWPLDEEYTTITSDFGYRTSPTAGASTNHKGTDIGTDYGSNVYAIESGTVTNISYQTGGAGYYITIDHGDGYTSTYMHLVKGSAVVSVGDEVSKGDIIGLADSTGVSTGNHLHLQIELDGTAIDPMQFDYEYGMGGETAISSSSSDDSDSSVSTSLIDVEEGDFYFNGIPDGKYSIASGLNLKIVVNTLASIADYIIGILTYIVRVVIVGWTSIIDRLFSWTVNSMFGVSEDLGITGTEVDDQDSSTRITIESIFYGEYDLLDINIFE